MRRTKLSAFAAIASAALMGTPALSQSFTTNGSGQYTGVTGLSVGGTLYDATFVDGSCNALFNNCTTFDLGIDDAALAADALLAAIQSNPDLNSNPQKTFGCSSTAECDIFIPFDFLSPNSFVVVNRSDLSDSVQLLIPPLGASDTSNDAFSVWARFALAAPASVPEPSTWAMMLLGFAAIGVSVRRKSRAPAVPQFV